jgi:hypothetical protein
MPTLSARTAQANASEQRGTLLGRERAKAAYGAALVDRYGHLPDIKRIVRHRHVPGALYKVRPLGNQVARGDRVGRPLVRRMCSISRTVRRHGKASHRGHLSDVKHMVCPPRQVNLQYAP